MTSEEQLGSDNIPHTTAAITTDVAASTTTKLCPTNPVPLCHQCSQRHNGNESNTTSPLGAMNNHNSNKTNSNVTKLCGRNGKYQL